MTKIHAKIWANCLPLIKDNVPPQSFKTWFSPIIAEKFENNILTIQVPSYFFFEYIEEHYIDLLKKVLKKIIGPEAKLEYNIVVAQHSRNKKSIVHISSQGKENTSGKSIDFGKDTASEIKNPFVIPGIKKLHIDSQLNPHYTFNNFIEGDCNRLARSAGKALAQNCGQNAFNPMFIYGGSGLGKTHLIHAIGLETKKFNPEKTVLAISSNRFQTQFTEAVRNNNVNDFIHFYQIIDLLIIDDIHELAGKEKTQQIFFHIFNHLHQSGKQLILTSDKAPVDLMGIEQRLLSRFKWGLSADLQPPDFETRKSILRHRLLKDGTKVDDEIIDYIALHIINSIRELEGCLISLIAHSTLNKNKINLQLAQEVVKKMVRSAKHEITVNFIKQVVCDYFNMPLEKLSAKSRKREIVQARQIAMFYSKELTKDSLASIGKKIGDKDHATVLHAHKTVNNLKETDKHYCSQVEEIGTLLNM